MNKPIPKGWRFYTADFSIENDKGRVMLTRQEAGRNWWHSLDEAGRENIPLFITGYGTSINEAIDNAIDYIPKEEPNP